MMQKQRIIKSVNMNFMHMYTLTITYHQKHKSRNTCAGSSSEKLPLSRCAYITHLLYGTCTDITASDIDVSSPLFLTHSQISLVGNFGFYRGVFSSSQNVLAATVLHVLWTLKIPCLATHSLQSTTFNF